MSKPKGTGKTLGTCPHCGAKPVRVQVTPSDRPRFEWRRYCHPDVPHPKGGRR